MANLTSIYANYCGVKLSDKPHDFPSLYFPTPSKYITIHSGSSNQNKNYDYYNEVVSLISNSLRENEIEIIQIGTESDVKVENCIDLRGATDIKQTAFIIENSLLHVGNESLWLQLAGSKNIPFIGLNSIYHVPFITPQYKGKYKIIDSDRNGSKPNFGQDELNKSINLIKPEVVAKSILEFLNLEEKSVNIETVVIGSNYNIKQIDLIPNFPVQPNILNGHKILIRADIECDYNAIGHALMYYKAGIITDKPIPPALLAKFKDNIPFIYYILNKDYDKDFVNILHTSGIQYYLLSKLDEKYTSKIKLDLFDYNPVMKKTIFDKSKISSDLYFKTNRLFHGNGKFYASSYHYKNNMPTEKTSDLEVGVAIDSDDFLDSCESYFFYKKTLD